MLWSEMAAVMRRLTIFANFPELKATETDVRAPSSAYCYANPKVLKKIIKFAPSIAHCHPQHIDPETLHRAEDGALNDRESRRLDIEIEQPVSGQLGKLIHAPYIK
jgi:hypothetical protein